MTTLEKFQEVANIKFIQTPSLADIEIGELNTADGYELFYVTKDIQNLNYENELFYYKPDFDTIMSEILNARISSNVVTVFVYDVDDHFDEFYMLDYIESEIDEEEFEKFTENA